MTPSKKLNEFLYANKRAVVLRDAEIETARILAEDRDLSPETRSALETALAKLKPTSSAA